MVGLCVIWGFQQVSIKLAAPLMDPVLQVGIRSLLAAVLVALLMTARKEALWVRDGTLRAGALVGALFGAEFLVVSLGLNFTTAGHMAVFLYTAPIFTALGLHWRMTEERLNRQQWIGVAIAFGGIVTAFSGSFGRPGAGHLLLGDALGVLGGIFWAATTLAIRSSRLSETLPGKTLLYQLTGAAVMLLPFAAFRGAIGPQLEGGAGLWGNLAFQTVVVAFASYLFWFSLLRRYLASRLSIFSFLTPLFGVGFGVLILRETPDSGFLIGALLVLAGISVVNRRPAQA